MLFVPNPRPDSSTMRARATIFCGVLPSATSRSSVVRSLGLTYRHASMFRMPQFAGPWESYKWVRTLVVHETLRREFAGFEKRVHSIARSDGRVRLLMSTPGVGAIVALTYVSAIDDPARFKSLKEVGAHFGLTPKKYQSGEKDVTRGITKIGRQNIWRTFGRKLETTLDAAL